MVTRNEVRTGVMIMEREGFARATMISYEKGRSSESHHWEILHTLKTVSALLETCQTSRTSILPEVLNGM